MNSKHRQHWQEDSNDYTFSQYAFYLGLLGVVIAGLLVGYVLLVRPPVVPVTRVVSLISSPGGDLPLVAFQHEDATALEAAFGDLCLRYEFDDIASLEETLAKLIEDSRQGFQAEDCVLVRLSAIGRLDDQQRPVIRGSKPDESLSLEKLAQSLSAVSAAHVILILDCGHEYVNDRAYEPGAQEEDDFNRFAEAVQQVSLPDNGRLQVLLHGLPGERPMYSIARRRSLLGLALEAVLAQQEDGKPRVWDTAAFAAELDQACLEAGGIAAPSVRLLATTAADPADREAATVYGIRDQRLEEAAEPEGEGQPPAAQPAQVAWHPLARPLEQKADAVWEGFRDVQQALPDMPVVLVHPQRWQDLTLSAIALSADQLQSAENLEEFQSAFQQTSGALVDQLDQLAADLGPSDSLIQRLGLTAPGDKEPEESPEHRQKREVAEAYLAVHQMRYRLPFYVAVADELGWVLPGNGRVRTLLRDTQELLDEYAKIRQSGQAASIFTRPEPTLDQYDDIVRGAENLRKFELDVRRSLSRFSTSELPDIAGMTRDMAVDALLRFPGLEVAAPPEDPDLAPDPDRILSREELLGLLDSSPTNLNPRVTSSERQKMAAARVQLYAALRRCLGEPAAPPAATRRLQRAAYRFGPSTFDWRQLAIRDAAPQPVVKVTGRQALESIPQYIEIGGSELPLGLEVEHVQVDVVCELIQAEEYFAFSPAGQGPRQVFAGNPVLVARQEAPEVDPQCRLQVSIVNRADPEQIFASFAVPLRLPLRNALEAQVTVSGGPPAVIREGQIPPPLRPFANRQDVSLDIQLRNDWHRPRTGQVLLYACAPPDARTMPGRINEEVQAKTRMLLDRDSLPLIARAELKLPPAFESAAPQPLQWQAPGEQEPPAVSADQGCLLVVQQDQVEQDWYYWLPIFPVEEPVVAVIPVMDSGDLSLQIERQRNSPAGAVSLKWYFTGERLPGGEAVLGSGEDRRQIQVSLNVLEKLGDARPYLYLDVDQWPRKYVFQFDGQRFQTATTRDAEVQLELPTAEGAPPAELVVLDATGSEWDQRLATRASRRDVQLTLRPNVPAVGEEFLFATARDHLRLFNVGDPYPLYYPRAITHAVQLVPKTGKLFLSSRVTDHRLTFPGVGRQFQVQPSVVLDGEQQPLGGSNRVQLTFDTGKPQIEDLRVLSAGPIHPDQLVQVRLAANDGDGVGIDAETGVQLFLSPRNGTLQSLQKPVPSKRGQSAGAYEFNAPAEEGTYTLGVRVTDRVGNVDEHLFGNNVKFQVVAKPTPAEQEAMKPKPVKHNLIVQVAIDGGPSIEPPKVVLVPPDAEAEALGGNRYQFRGLDAEKQYTVTATSQLASGIDKGAELVGEVSLRFSRTLRESFTEKKTIRLRRK